MDYARLFGPKVATNFSFDGKTGAEEWVRRARNYLLGRCRTTEWMLSWAERQAESINVQELVNEARMRGEREDVERISAEVWAFLNSCLQGEGQVTFGLVPNFNGMEAWRALTRPVTARSASRRVILGQQMRNPPNMKTMDDIICGLERFENSVKDFIMAGGTAPDDEEKCSIVMSKLPEAIQEKMMFSDFNSYAKLKKYLQEHVQRMRDLGIRSGEAFTR